MSARKPVYHLVASTQCLWTFPNDGKSPWRPATETEVADYVEHRKHG